MNELDLLKTHWQKDNEYIKFKKEDIITMVHKSSSSIVKWIFIIALIEFITIIMININSYYKEPETYRDYEVVLVIFYILIMIFLISSFYTYIKKVKGSSNAKELMGNILKAKQQTIYFIITSVIFFIISIICSSINGDIIEGFKKGYYDGSNGNPPNEFDEIGIYLGVFMGFILLSIIIYIYYKLVYLRFTANLQKNYKELLDLE